MEEQTVGPNLGADAIRAGLNSIVAGFVLVVTFMLVTYGRFGLYAAIALVMDLAITIAALAMLGATLTLPGMASILLALGMAVDADILINERTREELQKKNGVLASIEAGYRRAYTTIIDANTTTLIKMLILCYWYWSNPWVCGDDQSGYRDFHVHGDRPRAASHFLLAAAVSSEDVDDRNAISLLSRWDIHPVHASASCRARGIGSHQLGLDRACDASRPENGH